MEYVVVNPVLHDGVRYEVGQPFPIEDEAVIASLKAAGAIKLREEVTSAEQLAADRAALEAENADLRAKYAALLAQQSSKGKKTATDDQPAV